MNVTEKIEMCSYHHSFAYSLQRGRMIEKDEKYFMLHLIRIQFFLKNINNIA
jgi:predicted GNAT family acetyltransferase